MFNYKYLSGDNLNSTLYMWNKILNPKGVSIHILRRCEQRALVYVFRDSKLSENLGKSDVQELLAKFGYADFSQESCINKLRERFIDSSEFPHEIGAFLGYPLEDVVGFIENAGQNYICTGCWKVYYNEKEAVGLFMKYKKCKAVYIKLFENRARSVFQLTVNTRLEKQN